MRSRFPLLALIVLAVSAGLSEGRAAGPGVTPFSLNELLERDVMATLNDPRVQAMRAAITLCVVKSYEDDICGPFKNRKIPIEDIRGKFIVLGSGFNVTQSITSYGIIFVDKPDMLYDVNIQRGEESYTLFDFRETNLSLRPGKDSNGFRNKRDRINNILLRGDLSI